MHHGEWLTTCQQLQPQQDSTSNCSNGQPGVWKWQWACCRITWRVQLSEQLGWCCCTGLEAGRQQRLCCLVGFTNCTSCLTPLCLFPFVPAQLIRVCSEHGQAVTALSVYEWMKAPASVGGAGLGPTVYTYTAAMRAALAAGLLDRALRVWEDAQAAQCPLDCRLCITYIEVRPGRVGAVRRPARTSCVVWRYTWQRWRGSLATTRHNCRTCFVVQGPAATRPAHGTLLWCIRSPTLDGAPCRSRT